MLPPEVIILGTYSENSAIGGRVFYQGGVSPSIMAGTHGYGFGVVLIDDDYKDNHTNKPR